MCQDESVKLEMVTDQENIAPILLFQHLSQLRLVIPTRIVLRRPFDRGAVRLEARIAYVRFRAELFQREFVAKIRFENRAPRDAWCTS